MPNAVKRFRRESGGKERRPAAKDSNSEFACEIEEIRCDDVVTFLR
jgi:hypothetical protein